MNQQCCRLKTILGHGVQKHQNALPKFSARRKLKVSYYLLVNYIRIANALSIEAMYHSIPIKPGCQSIFLVLAAGF